MFLLLGSFLPKSHAGYFWHLTDFHVDPYYQEWGSRWRWNSCNRNVSDSQGPLGDYECDPPYALLRSAVQAIQQHGPQPAFVVWTGDNTPHPQNLSWLGTEATLEITRNCTNIIRQGLGDVQYPVIVSLGNHDYFPKNQLPGESNAIYQGVYEMWKQWLNTSDMESTFKRGAYYTTVLPGADPPLRFVVVNTNLYSSANKAVEGEDDPGEQFAWMKSTLDQSRERGEKVHLITHIPPGVLEIDGSARWFTEQFNTRFNDLVIQYGDVIVGSYSAHQHLDTFRIFYKEGEPVLGMLVAPSVTPWRARVGATYISIAHNPAIRRIMFDDVTYELTDVEQYYLDLPKANTEQDPEWEKLYSFQQMYGLERVNGRTLHKLVTEDFLEINSSKFFQYYQANAVNAHHESNKPCDEQCQRQHVCAITKVGYQQFDSCLRDVSTTRQPSTTTSGKDDTSGDVRAAGGSTSLLMLTALLILCATA